MLFMGASSLALAVAFHAMRGMYLHAERLLAKAGVATARGGGSPTLETKRSESGKGVAKRRAAQAQRGSLGTPLAGARGGAPLSGFCCCFCCLRRGVAGRVDRPAEEGGGVPSGRR